jgi:PAS domain S-box-containing protein
MKDEEKTKEELVSELVKLRQRLTELEGLEIQYRRMEEALQESEKRFHLMAENIQAAFWMADSKMTQCFYITPAYEKIWGRTCESWYKSPKSFLDTILPEDRKRVIDSLSGLIDGHTDLNEEFRILRPNGSIRWIHGRAFRVRNKHGELCYITESKVNQVKISPGSLKESLKLLNPPFIWMVMNSILPQAWALPSTPPMDKMPKLY